MTAPSPSPDERVSIGTVLDGRYRIDALLGSGGMGRVYRGEHTGIGRQVAIKVLHTELNRNREAAARFQREALASGRLDHPNIVGVSDFGVLDDGACYLVMEALEGESLGDRLQREHRVPWRDALTIQRGVMSGLRHAHDRGVVHRDIKPDNVFLAQKDGELVVKILDFGIAKLYAGSSNDPASTRAGLTVGTPAYLSPEQAVGGEIKPASDIYSATILLFEMLTGHPPFEDKDPLAMLGAHVSRQPPAIAQMVPDIAGELPAGLEDMVQRGLAKIAAERIPSATDYIAWIDAIVSAGTATGSAPVIATGGSPLDALTPAVLATPLPGTLPSPVPGTLTAPGAATPVPGTVTPVPGTVTPVPGTATPVPGTASPLAAVAAPSIAMTPLPTAHTPVPDTQTPPPIAVDRATRAVSLADAAPIPRRWLIRGAIVAVVTIVVVILLVIARGGGKAEDNSKKPAPTRSKSKSSKTDKTDKTVKRIDPPTPAPEPEPKVAPADLPPDDEHATQLKAALYELKEGKTCPDRHAAISRLLELDDPAAIPSLKAARYRMRGGVLGIGDSNTNSCLRKDAEAAIKTLSRNLPSK